MDRKIIRCVKRKTGRFLLISALYIVLCISITGFAGCGNQVGHTHAFTEQSVKQIYLAEEATCTAAAKYYYSCACGEKGTNTFAYGELADHTEVIDAAVAPTKTDTGLTEGSHCGVCGKILKEQQEVSATGSLGLEYTLNSDGKTCTVTGIGTCTDSEIIIPVKSPEDYRVTKIGDEAFSDCGEITSIVIPDSVTSIGEYAFSGCTELTSITIPDSVNYIGDYAFRNCGELNYNEYDSALYLGNESNPYVLFIKPLSEYFTTCTINQGCKIIYGHAFEGCVGLTDVNIPDSVTSISAAAFHSCSGLTSITIPDSVTNINEGAFNGCYGLAGVTIGSGVTCIGDWAFSECSGLGNINVSPNNAKYHSNGNCLIETESKTLVSGCKNSVIPADKSVTSIGKYAFFGSDGLANIDIPESVTNIGDMAFYNCRGLESINVSSNNEKYHSNGNCLIETESKTLILGCKNSVIPADKSVTSIGCDAFGGCSGLTSIVIPDSVTSIGCDAFGGCSGLTSIVIPDSVTSIGGGAFSGCYGLAGVTIGSGVTSIGDWAFSECSGLTEIHYNGTMAQWKAISKESGWDSVTGSYTIYCTDGNLTKDET